MDECRLSGVEFDVAASAGWYSAIAGLLAGFAFVAVLLPLDHEVAEDESDQVGGGVVVFVSAFLSLLLLSLSYAVLAGRVGGAGAGQAAVHEQMLDGAAFGLTTLLLLAGLGAVLRSYGLNRLVLRPARGVVVGMTAVLGPIVVVVLQYSNALDVSRARLALAPGADACPVLGMPTSVWVDLAISTVAVVAVLLLSRWRSRLPHRPGAQPLLAKAVLGFTAGVIGWSAVVLPLLPAEVTIGTAFEHSALAVTAVAVVLFSALTWSGTPTDQRRLPSS